MAITNVLIILELIYYVNSIQMHIPMPNSYAIKAYRGSGGNDPRIHNIGCYGSGQIHALPRGKDPPLHIEGEPQ